MFGENIILIQYFKWGQVGHGSFVGFSDDSSLPPPATPIPFLGVAF